MVSMSKCELDLHVYVDLRFLGHSYIFTLNDGSKTWIPSHLVSLSSYKGHKTWIVRLDTCDLQFAYDRIVKVCRRN